VRLYCYPQKYDDRTILAEGQILSRGSGVTLWWDQNDTHDAGLVGFAVPSLPSEVARPHAYEVTLRPEDLGAMLTHMPATAVPAVFDELLRDGDPEVIDAVVGRVIAHLAARTRRLPEDSKPRPE
jgi:hypothetical protein